MAWKIEFEAAALKELKALDKAVARRIIDFLRQRIASAEDPRTLGKPLKGNLRHYWRYRVGDYRLVCTVQDEALMVMVVRVAHRRHVY